MKVLEDGTNHQQGKIIEIGLEIGMEKRQFYTLKIDRRPTRKFHMAGIDLETI